MANSPKLARYPDRGRLLVAADLHGNLRDFLSIVARFEGMGDDAHLLFLGDLLHGPLLLPEQWPSSAAGAGQVPLRGRPYRDESPAILLGLQLLGHIGRFNALAHQGQEQCDLAHQVVRLPGGHTRRQAGLDGLPVGRPRREERRDRCWTDDRGYRHCPRRG